MNIGGLQIGFGTEVQDKISLNIYFSGCKNNKNCKKEECHNPKLLDFKYGKVYLDNIAEIVNVIRTGFVECVCFLGGEPLDQDENSLIHLIKELKYVKKDIPIYVYSGYDDKEFLLNKKIILEVSGIIYGHYEKGYIKSLL